MEISATHTNIADYVSDSSYSGSKQDRENTARLIVGGALVLGGLIKGSKTGLLIAGIGGGLAALNLLSSKNTERESSPAVKKKSMVRRAITVGCSQPECYAFWSRPETLQKIFPGVESISTLPGGKWLWRLPPAGSQQLTFETEAIKSEPPTLMSWRSVAESPLEHAGSVTFKTAPAGRGTEVLLTMSWIGKGSLAQLGIPLLGKGTGWYANEALRRSKQLLETKELSTAAI